MGINESKALALLSKNRQLHKEIIEKHRGRWLKEIGDGTLSCFNSVTDAALCALELQEQTSLDEDLSLGIGLHQGEIVFAELSGNVKNSFNYWFKQRNRFRSCSTVG